MRKLFVKASKITVLIALAFVLSVGQGAASELIMGMSTEPSIDPHFFWMGTNVAYSKHIFGRLVDMSPDAKIVPDLATSWKAIDDTHWEFKLRQGVKFHDGSAFTAEDVIFSWERIPKVPNNPASYVGVIKGITAIKAVNAHKIIITTDKPYPTLLAKLVNMAIVSKRAAQKATTADFSKGISAIGTGPYKFVEYVPGDHFTIERNPGYWGAKPGFKKVKFKIMTNDAARVAAIMGGDVDVIESVPPSQAASLKKGAKINLFMRASDRVIFLGLDNVRNQSPFVTGKNGKPLDRNPLKDLRVRKAMSLAINRQAICSRIMDGLAVPASQLCPEAWPGFNPAIKLDPYDVAGAKKLLSEAGYAEGFGLTIHGPNDRYVNDAEVAQAVAQQLARIGIQVKVETMPKSIFFGKMMPPKNEFSFWLLGWGTSGAGSSSHALKAVIHTHDKAQGFGIYNGGYSNPHVDQIIKPAVLVVDPVESEAALKKAMQAIMDDQAIIPLYAQVTIVAARKGITYEIRADEKITALHARPE